MIDLATEKGLSFLRSLPYYPEIQAKSKFEVIDITLTVISVAFEVVSQKSATFQAEITDWNEGRRMSLGVLPKGPFVTLEKRDGRIVYLGKGSLNPQVTFLFKNLDSAFLVFTAQMSAHQAVAECRVLVDGDNSYAMELNRALAIVETYLFPPFIAHKIFKRPPDLQKDPFKTRVKILSALVPALIRHGIKLGLQTNQKEE
jgi:hypothetical protein